LSALLLSVAASMLAAPSPALAKDEVTMRLDWTLQGFHLPFVWALDKGYYDAEGIDAKLLEGRGSGNTAQLIGAKTDMFGGADASTAALTRSRGAEIKVLASFIQRSEGAVVSFASSGFKTPKDLIGKTVGTSQGSSSTVLFHAMLKASNIADSQVNIVTVDSTAKVASLLQHRVDAITGLMSAECAQVQAESEGQAVNCMRVADFGVKALGEALIVNDDTIKANPDLVRRFVKASLRGWAEAVNDPAQAAEIGHKHFPLADPKVLKAQFEMVLQSLHSPSSEGHPIGWMAEDDWKGTIEMLKTFMGLTSNAPISDYYTDAYIPEAK